MSNLLDWPATRSAELVFIPFGYGSIPQRFFDNDLIIANELKKHMRNADGLKVIDVEYTPQEILGLYRFFDPFIGMRLHSILFSITMRLPTIALIYDTKTVELLKGRKRNSCIPIMINELDTGKLKEAVNALSSV